VSAAQARRPTAVSTWFFAHPSDSFATAVFCIIWYRRFISVKRNVTSERFGFFLTNFSESRKAEVRRTPFGRSWQHTPSAHSRECLGSPRLTEGGRGLRGLRERPGGPVPYERSRCAEHRGGCTRDVAAVHPAHRGPHHVTARERTHRPDGTSSASHRREVEWTGATRTSQNAVSTWLGE